MKAIIKNSKKMKPSRMTFLTVILTLMVSMVINSCKKDEETPIQTPNPENNTQIVKTGTNTNGSELYYGHEIFTRTTGSPNTFTRQIENPLFTYFTNEFVLKICNGSGPNNRVSSAVIKIDGVQIVGPSDFSQNVDSIFKPIPNLTSNSTLEVELRGKPGGFIDLWIAGSLLPGNVILRPEGGVYQALDGNVIINVPPGAVNNITLITIVDKSSKIPMELRSKDYIQYELLPSGLVFNEPVVFTLPYVTDTCCQNCPLAAFSVNDGTWEEIDILNIDRINKKVQLQIEHFSMWLIQVQDFYLVVDIPGKYLKKSDILYTLAHYQVNNSQIDKFTWFPGHVAMYLGSDDPTQSDIIESTPPAVTEGYLTEFRCNSEHLYMGPRRYIGLISDQQRIDIADYAVDKLGNPWYPVGQGGGNSNAYSCVGLVEDAYDEYDLSIVPPLVEFPILYPYDQYKRTKPIDEITVKSGEELVLRAYGVIYGEDEYFQTRDGVNFYTDIQNPPPLIDGEDCDKEFKEFIWTPGQSDVGMTYHVTFRVNVTVPNGVEQRSQTIAINVIESQNSEDMLYIASQNITTLITPNVPGSHYMEISMWQNAGFDVTTMSTMPPASVTITPELLETYEVLRLVNYNPKNYTVAEGNAIYNWVNNGGKLLADIHYNADVNAVSNFGVDYIEGAGGGYGGLNWFYHGAPLYIGPVTGPFSSGVASIGIEAMDRPHLKPNHQLSIAASYSGYPAVVYRTVGSGKVVITFDGGSYSLDVVHPGNAYRSCISYASNHQFVQNIINYFEP